MKEMIKVRAIVDTLIDKNGIVETRRLILAMRDDSLRHKKNLLDRGAELKNIPSHIRMADDMLAYLRDKAIESLLYVGETR